MQFGGVEVTAAPWIRSADDRAFVELMDNGHPKHRYAAVWSIDATVEQAVVEGCGPTERLKHTKAHRSRLSPNRLVGGTDGDSGVSGDGIGLASASSVGATEGPARRTAGECGGGADSSAEGRASLEAPAAQLRSSASRLHRQLAEAVACRSSGRLAGFRRIDGTVRGGAPRAPEKMEDILFDPDTSIRRA